MKKALVISLIFLLTIPGWSQEKSFKKYRYTYLWDVTLSMYGWTNDPALRPAKNRDLGIDIRGYNKETDIYDVVRNNLMEDINTIWDETAEIVVIPFQEGICEIWKEKATAAGKKAILDKIKNYRNATVTDTEIAKPLQYVIDNVLSEDRIDFLKLMTDGKTQNADPLYAILNDWCKTAIAKDVYAFYIRLTSAAVDQRLHDIIQEQCRITTTDGTKITYTIIRPYDRVSVNVNDTYPAGAFRVQCDVQPATNLKDSGIKLHFAVEDNPYIVIDADVEPDDHNVFVVPFNFHKSENELKGELVEGDSVIATISLLADSDNSDNKDDIVRLINQQIRIDLTARFENSVQIRWGD